jgi:agmatinase
MSVEELAAILRPAGGGIHLVSTGKAQQLELQRRLYGAQDESEIRERFLTNLGRLATARGVILGVPSDTGAGFVRGANLGPQVLRSELLRLDPAWPAKLEAANVVDLGDVFVVPQLLHDEMLSEAQLRATRAAIYPEVAPAVAATYPVSALSIAERAWDLIFSVNPRIAPFVLGGDHSVAWPLVAALARARTDRWAIVQIDAHTDLLAERLGVKYCFATWSYHANELLHRDGRLVQVGIRASGKDRAHWESTLNVRQFWAPECRQSPEPTIEAIVAHLKAVGAEAVYFSNDIDGTDAEFAVATGTPEPLGLYPVWVERLIRRLGTEVGLLGGDIVEVAPPLQFPNAIHSTTALAARYFRQTIASTLRVQL